MAFIVDLFSTRTDKAIQIGNEELLRPLSFGTNWQRIRIGVRLGFTAAAANIAGAGFVYGVCAGNNGWKNPNGSSTELIGAHFGATADNTTYTYTIAAPPYFTTGGSSCPIFTKINGVTTNRSSSSATAYITALTTTARTAFYFDLSKGTPYSGTCYNPGSIANVQTDITHSLFIQGMETDGTPNTSTSFGAQTWTHPGAGLMDTFFMSWNKSVPALNIFDIAVARIL